MYKYLITYYYGKGPTPTAFNVELDISELIDSISSDKKQLIFHILSVDQAIAEEYIWTAHWPKPLLIN